MNVVRKVVERPQTLWLRKLIFQVHLWVGLGIGLYILLIGITGAALVFREEMQQAWELPQVSPMNEGAAKADLPQVADRMRAAYPDRQLYSISNPYEHQNAITGYLRKGEDYLAVLAHPVTGEIIGTSGSESSFLRWLQLLHFNLLSGRTGRIVNGVGALFLLALCVTGMVIWWPGVKNWKRAVTVDFSRKWKRVNWDLHSASGFWTAAVLSMWAITGAYFAWPTQFRAAVNWFSPVSLAKIPKTAVAEKGKHPQPDLRGLIAEAQSRSAGASLLSIAFSLDDKSHTRIYMAREKPLSYETADFHYFDPFTGKHAAVWRRGVNQSAGDVVMSWIGPLHFGTFGGHGAMGVSVKVLWVLLGLTPPLLMITGFLMYWNRYLAKKLRKLQPAVREPARQREAMTV